MPTQSSRTAGSPRPALPVLLLSLLVLTSLQKRIFMLKKSDFFFLREGSREDLRFYGYALIEKLTLGNKWLEFSIIETFGGP